MEKLISISRKQHDAINSLGDAIKANQEQLKTVANIILLGQEEELGQVGIIGARFVKQTHVGSSEYFLVLKVPGLEVPDISPPAEEREA